MIPNVKKILILVETDDGKAHQVLATHEQKQIALMMLSGQGLIRFSPEIEPVEITFKAKKI